MGLLNDKGSVTVMFIGLMPVFVLFLLFMLNAGGLFFRRERLQIAADRAAFTGAASLADDLNRATKLNWQIASEYRNTRRQFLERSENKDSGEKEIRASIAFQQDRAADMEVIIDEIFRRAEQRAARVFTANMPWANAEIIALPRHNVVDCFQDPETGEFLRQRVSYDTVRGFVFDPVEAREEAGGGDLIRYCAKDPMARMAVIVDAIEVSPAPFLPSWFGPEGLHAEAVAQPYGGSLKEIAHNETSSFEDVVMQEETYRPALVPVTR